MLDIFIKVIVTSKAETPIYIIEESRSLLVRVTHEEFRTMLLPATQRAILRNPEVILRCVGPILSGLSLDLSQYCLDIGRSLSSKVAFTTKRVL